MLKSAVRKMGKGGVVGREEGVVRSGLVAEVGAAWTSSSVSLGFSKMSQQLSSSIQIESGTRGDLCPWAVSAMHLSWALVDARHGMGRWYWCQAAADGSVLILFSQGMVGVQAPLSLHVSAGAHGAVGAAGHPQAKCQPFALLSASMGTLHLAETRG